MHSCVTSKNAKWCHLIWPTLYIELFLCCLICCLFANSVLSVNRQQTVTGSLKLATFGAMLFPNTAFYRHVSEYWICGLRCVAGAAVAPRRVEWTYQVGDGEVRLASDGSELRLRQNVATTLTCRATVERTDFRPDVVIRLGDRDITARTTINATERRRTTTGDGFSNVPDWTLERQVRWDAAVAGQFHDKNLTCFAVMKHFSPITSSLLLTIACESLYPASYLLVSK